MIKGLIFSAALLVLPISAHSGDPAIDLSVQVIPQGTVPPTPAAPAGAAVAGFTTLALNSDFTVQMRSNWLGGCSLAGNGQPVGGFYSDDTGHTWWLNLWWSYNYQNCNATQKPDPTFGGLVLDMPWTVDNNYNSVGTVLETASWDYTSSPARGTANSFPIGSYYEVVARMAPTNAAGAYMVLNTWGPDGIANQNCGCQMEWDVMETDGSNLNLYDSAAHNWGTGGQGAFILQPWTSLAPGTNFDPAQYNTYGLRVTYDGASNAVGCTYINNVFQKCAALPNGVNATEQGGRNFLVLQNACDYWNQPGGQCTQGQEQHLYVKSVHVWSCADWRTTQCSGAVMTGTP